MPTTLTTSSSQLQDRRDSPEHLKELENGWKNPLDLNLDEIRDHRTSSDRSVSRDEQSSGKQWSHAQTATRHKPNQAVQVSPQKTMNHSDDPQTKSREAGWTDVTEKENGSPNLYSPLPPPRRYSRSKIFTSKVHHDEDPVTFRSGATSRPSYSGWHEKTETRHNQKAHVRVASGEEGHSSGSESDTHLKELEKGWKDVTEQDNFGYANQDYSHNSLEGSMKRTNQDQKDDDLIGYSYSLNKNGLSRPVSSDRRGIPLKPQEVGIKRDSRKLSE